MKNWFAQLAGLVMVTALTLTSCEKDETQVTLNPTNSPTFSASTNTVVLQQANSAQNAITFTWTPVNYSWGNASSSAVVPTVQYAAEIDKKGNNFARPVTVTLGTGTTTTSTLTVEALNQSLNTLGLPNGVATDVDVRLKAYVAANTPTYSPTVTLKATPYKVCIAPTTDKWSIIGPAGVDWSTDVPLTYDCDTKTYVLTRTLNAGEFKFRKNNDWAGNLGGDGAGDKLKVDGANIAVATAGMYTISLNLAGATPTYSLTKK
ncbi:SusE domain-containing protein [Hymenobacter glacieicola]|uniref:SusE outer membrane protein domain-containing protein n=1 Tax=Hymenobacter glacieicola TaxID=1562124 RepID=A0ABQ1WQ93_9BACT|nr:SusE domain-containing protein [Hymenobacter glacieicola]GGG41383.1 hypothetical protein GCM10011378_17070 [Hymenobacter glacieicola]